MSQRFINSPWLSDVFTTASATATSSTTATYTPPSGSVGHLELRVDARNTTTGAMGSAMLYVPFKNVAGVVTLGTALSLVGTAGALVGDLAAALAAVVLSGSTITPQVTGIAATSIEWLLDARYSVN